MSRAVEMPRVPVRLENCAKTFADGTRGVDGIDLSIEGGETMVFLGPSGCGKTTSLRMIAGLDRPDAGGRIWFGSDDVTRVPIERRGVGMVFQNYALFPNFDVAGNIGYGLRAQRLSVAVRRERVGEMLALMRLEPLAGRRVEQLSGGQRQRVALARALATRPRVLLLDEPLAALDAKLRESLRAEIDALLRMLRITAIYVTHDQAEAMALGDRIVVMERGRIAQVGSPREIYRAPANRFVAEFIGAINVLRGHSDDGRFVTPAGEVPWNSAALGECEAFFRPQDVTIVRVEDAQLRGTVRRASFLGDRVRVVLDGICDGETIVETRDDVDVQPGAPVGLELRPGALVPFDGLGR